MTDDRTPVTAEPSVAAGELQTLSEFLDYYRSVVRRKAEGLDAQQLAHTITPSTMSLGGMVAHLAWVEDYWFPERMDGAGPSAPWDQVPWDDDPDGDWTWAQGRSAQELLELFDTAVERSRAVHRRWTDLDEELSVPGDSGMTVRWVLVHMVEEYARHAGHADLLREQIDGVVGD